MGLLPRIEDLFGSAFEDLFGSAFAIMCKQSLSSPCYFALVTVDLGSVEVLVFQPIRTPFWWHQGRGNCEKYNVRVWMYLLC